MFALKVFFFFAAAGFSAAFVPIALIPDARRLHRFTAPPNEMHEEGPVFREYSPTIRFTYVTPPPSSSSQYDKESQQPAAAADWSDHDVMMSDADIMTMTRNSNSNNSTTNMFVEVAKRHGEDKPIALYLPGLDGYGISTASFQFNDLSKTFELWRMTVGGDDRTSFHELVQKPVQFIEEIVGNTDRPVYVIGESFGGMLTAAVALQVLKKSEREGREKRKTPIKGMVLANPATSFDSSSWDVIAPLLTTLGKLAHVFEPYSLVL